MLVGVPIGIEFRIAQAKIGGHVDDLDALGELGDFGVRRAMGQAAEDDVDVVPIHLVGSDKFWRIEAGKMREHLREGLPGMALGDQPGELKRRMQRGKPDHICAGIAGGAEHGGSNSLGVGHGWTPAIPRAHAGLKEFGDSGKGRA